MKRITFRLGICLLVFSSAIFGQTPPRTDARQEPAGEPPGDLCAEKQKALDEFEAEAPEIRATIARREELLKQIAKGIASNPSQATLNSLLVLAVRNLEAHKKLLQDAETLDDREKWQIQLVEDRVYMDNWTEYVAYKRINDSLAGFKSSVQKQAERDLAERKERQTYVANQISLLRDRIPAGGCGARQTASAIAVGPGVWISTGITLRKGQGFKVAATGSIRAKDYPFTEIGPGGNGYYSLKGLIKDPSGANPQFMTLGALSTEIARFDGVLYLACTRSNYYNNGDPKHGEDQGYLGAYQVTVTVEK